MSSFFLVLIAIAVETVFAADYCSMRCMQGGQHTMCRFPSNYPGPSCGGEGRQSLTRRQIKELLDVHNTWRDYVAAGRETRTAGGALPQAANMMVLTWNDEIAKVAQRWARQCNYGHDQCRDIPGMTAGQNVAMIGTSNQAPVNITSLAWMWYNKEVSMFSSYGVDQYQFSESTGHFTQWIWAKSYQLGCGYTGYPDQGFHDFFLVCNYGPAGNVMGRQIYRRGSPCSACPQGTTCGGDSRYPHLCKASGGTVPQGGGGGGAGGGGGYGGSGGSGGSGGFGGYGGNYGDYDGGFGEDSTDKDPKAFTTDAGTSLNALALVQLLTLMHVCLMYI